MPTASLFFNALENNLQPQNCFSALRQKGVVKAKNKQNRGCKPRFAACGGGFARGHDGSEQKIEGKYKFALWIKQETLEQVKALYRQDDCRSKSEFIEKAILFYIGYLTAENEKSFLPNAFLSALKGVVSESDNRMGRLLFKLSVELAMLMNVVASMQGIDRQTLTKLRGECVKEVKRLNGGFSFDDAVRWQQE